MHRTGERSILTDRISPEELEAMRLAAGLTKRALEQMLGLGANSMGRYLPGGKYTFGALEAPGVREVFRRLGVGRDGKLLGRPRKSEE